MEQKKSNGPVEDWTRDLSYAKRAFYHWTTSPIRNDWNSVSCRGSLLTKYKYKTDVKQLRKWNMFHFVWFYRFQFEYETHFTLCDFIDFNLNIKHISLCVTINFNWRNLIMSFTYILISMITILLDDKMAFKTGFGITVFTNDKWGAVGKEILYFTSACRNDMYKYQPLEL